MLGYVFSAPGRTEISGNHTDHQHGCVLAASVNLKTTAVVTLNDEGVIRVQSEGYAPVEVDLSRLDVAPEEVNTTAALVRGVAAAFAQRGAELKGFDAKVSSTVLPGSGLSSSAAFEVLIGTILSAVNFLRVCFLDGHGPMVALTVCGAMLFIVIFAKLIGSMIPLIVKKVKLDPALIANPAISSVSDAVALSIYFLMARLFLGI